MAAAMNAPDRYEKFVVPEGQSKQAPIYTPSGRLGTVLLRGTLWPSRRLTSGIVQDHLHERHESGQCWHI